MRGFDLEAIFEFVDSFTVMHFLIKSVFMETNITYGARNLKQFYHVNLL